MKVRSGFVSNSSSSSFVIAVKKGCPCPTCGRTDINFLDLVETMGRNNSDSYEATQLHRRGAHDVYDEIERDNENWWSPEERKRWANYLGDWIAKEEEGYEIGYVEISYHDEATNTIFNDLKDRKAITVLYGDH